MNRFLYLLRRELWEHRALYVVPLVLGGLFVLGALFTRVSTEHAVAAHEEFEQLVPYSLALVVAIFVFVMTIVTVFYLLDALHADRKDRSILFWKSLPVSDTQTVLSKYAVAMLVVPALVIASSILTHLAALIAGSIRLGIGGYSVLGLWGKVEFLETAYVCAYALLAQVLWYAPLFAYFLLISAWARRAPLLWATLTPLALMFAEYQIFDTDYVADLIGHRLIGVFQEHMIFGNHEHSGMPRLVELVDPRPFLTDPGLYLGLLAAALMLAAAIWLRRYRDET